MFWKNKDNVEIKLTQMNELLKKSFANVKRDTTNIFQWLNYFYRRNIEQDQMIRRLQAELSYMPRTREDIRRIVDYYYSFESITLRIKELNEKVEELGKKQQVQVDKYPMQTMSREPHADLSHIEKRLEILEHKQPSMREKIIKRLTKNSKEYVKGIILSYIRKYEKISALQLKEIMVDEQNLCSKSSFYRLLEEIEEMDEVGVVKQGKEKHYLSKAKSYIRPT